MKPLILIGGGGHCRSIIDVVESTNDYEIQGILDVEKNVGEKVFDYVIIGTDDKLDDYIRKGFSFLNSLGQIGLPDLRRKVNKRVLEKGGRFATVISKYSRIGKNVQVGEGTVIMHNTILNANAQIGKHCIVNSNAVIEHDCCLGDYVHIAPSATINGGCRLKDDSFVGSNSTIIQGVSLEEKTVIGAGSLVLKSLTKSGIYFGSPLRKR